MPDVPSRTIERKPAVREQAELAAIQKHRERSGRPPPCRGCDERCWWNGWRCVFVVVQVVGNTQRQELEIPRAKCSACKVSFSVYPPGLYPRRQYQLDVVAATVGRRVMGSESHRAAAAPAGASPTSCRRWAHWVERLARPEMLLALVRRLDPDAPAGTGLAAQSTDTAGEVPLLRKVLTGLEQVGAALERLGLGVGRSGLSRLLHWQLSAHGDIYGLVRGPSSLSPAMALGGAAPLP